MATIKKVRGFTPKWGQDCFIADNATIIGDVVIGDKCSVWFQAVVRGDVNSIRIGNKVNVQDGAVIHCTFEQSKTIIEDNVSIGHNAIIHGCHLQPSVLVGMGAIIMDHAVVESNCIIGAGAVVPANMVCKSGYVYTGIPARQIKPISDDLKNGEIDRISKNYIKYAGWFSEE